MIDKTKKIGLWGMGRVGTAISSFFHQHGYHVSCMDKNKIQTPFPFFLENEDNKAKFFASNDIVIPSPGIDIRSCYEKYKNKIIPEVELFAHFFHRPIIAISGSVGKTTVTSLLSQLLSKSKNVITGGNIGTPLFDLINKQSEVEWAVLELSSFQLEYCSTFAPKVAVITNITQNHLDRHSTMHHYIQAKCTMINHQKETDITLVPFSLINEIQKLTKKQINYFSARKPTKKEVNKLKEGDRIFYLDGNIIYALKGNIINALHDTSALPSFTFNENWLIICALLSLLNIDFAPLKTYAQAIQLPDHRLELVKTINGIDFYNDSKATTPTATRAAVARLQGKPIILLLGGLSKGIDREPLIAWLKNKVKITICFGKEAEILYNLCIKYTIKCSKWENLSDAFEAALLIATKNDIILLSPAGSSFDLFDNYEQRGTYFKKLINQHPSQ